MVRDPASEWSIVGSNCTVEGARLFSNCSGTGSVVFCEGAHLFSSWSGFGGTGSVMFCEGAHPISGNSVISWVSTGVVCVFLISFFCAAGWWSPVALIKF